MDDADASDLLVLALDGTITARSLRTGALLWSISAPERARLTASSRNGFAIDAVAGSQVHVEVVDGDVLAYSVLTRQPSGFLSAGTDLHYLARLRGRDGAVLWQAPLVELPSPSAPGAMLCTGPRVIIAIPAHTLAVDLATGAVLWSVPSVAPAPSEPRIRGVIAPAVAVAGRSIAADAIGRE